MSWDLDSLIYFHHNPTVCAPTIIFIISRRIGKKGKEQNYLHKVIQKRQDKNGRD
jgi:hypothetical protein